VIDLLLDIGPTPGDELNPRRVFTMCALVALRYRDAKRAGGYDSHADAADDLSKAIEALVKLWGISL
jgi:hypothetical protein